MINNRQLPNTSYLQNPGQMLNRYQSSSNNGLPQPHNYGQIPSAFVQSNNIPSVASQNSAHPQTSAHRQVMDNNVSSTHHYADNTRVISPLPQINPFMNDSTDPILYADNFTVQYDDMMVPPVL